MNLTLSQPVIPKENILLLQGRYDLLVEAELTEQLWQKWKSRGGLAAAAVLKS